MAKLIYAALASLDLYVEDATGDFSWAAPDAEVHAFVNDLERSVGTHLYGRRMYETMRYWENPPGLSSEPWCIQDYAAIWQAAEKIVYSRTLDAVATPRTRLERDFRPEAICELKAASERDMSIGGADLAGQALEAGLVDEIHVFAVPVIVGGGKPAFPHGGARLDLALLDATRFENGTAYSRYAVRGA